MHTGDVASLRACHVLWRSVLRLAGEGEAAERLYHRMQAGSKGARAVPDAESATQLFALYHDAQPAPDVQGMWRCVQGTPGPIALHPRLQLQKAARCPQQHAPGAWKSAVGGG